MGLSVALAASPLAKLPMELRDEIWRLLLATSCGTHVYFDGPDATVRAQSIPDTVIAFLSTCRQMKGEGTDYVFSNGSSLTNLKCYLHNPIFSAPWRDEDSISDWDSDIEVCRQYLENWNESVNSWHDTMTFSRLTCVRDVEVVFDGWKMGSAIERQTVRAMNAISGDPKGYFMLEHTTALFTLGLDARYFDGSKLAYISLPSNHKLIDTILSEERVKLRERRLAERMTMRRLAMLQNDLVTFRSKLDWLLGCS